MWSTEQKIRTGLIWVRQVTEREKLEIGLASSCCLHRCWHRRYNICSVRIDRKIDVIYCYNQRSVHSNINARWLLKVSSVIDAVIFTQWPTFGITFSHGCAEIVVRIEIECGGNVFIPTFDEGCFGHCSHAAEVTIPVVLVKEGVSTCGMFVVAKQARHASNIYRNPAFMWYWTGGKSLLCLGIFNIWVLSFVVRTSPPHHSVLLHAATYMWGVLVVAAQSDFVTDTK